MRLEGEKNLDSIVVTPDHSFKIFTANGKFPKSLSIHTITASLAVHFMLFAPKKICENVQKWSFPEKKKIIFI